MIRVRPDGTGWNSLQRARNILGTPTVLYSISLGTIPMMVVVGISRPIASGLKVMDTELPVETNMSSPCGLWWAGLWDGLHSRTRLSSKMGHAPTPVTGACGHIPLGVQGKVLQETASNPFHQGDTSDGCGCGWYESDLPGQLKGPRPSIGLDKHGYIIRVSPSGYEPQPLDDWETLGDAQLVAKLDTPSQVRLLAAQRSLLRRPLSPELLQALLDMIHDTGVDLRVRVGALYALTQRGVHGTVSWGLLNQLKPLISVPELAPFVVRALGDMGIDQVTHKGVGPVQAQWFEAPLRSEDPRTRLEAIIGAARQGKKEIAPVIAESLGHVDPKHTAFRALARLGASEPCFSILIIVAAPEQKKGASFALMRMHQSDVVEGLSQSQENLEQTYLLAALCRLVH